MYENYDNIYSYYDKCSDAHRNSCDSKENDSKKSRKAKSKNKALKTVIISVFILYLVFKFLDVALPFIYTVLMCVLIFFERASINHLQINVFSFVISLPDLIGAVASIFGGFNALVKISKLPKGKRIERIINRLKSTNSFERGVVVSLIVICALVVPYSFPKVNAYYNEKFDSFINPQNNAVNNNENNEIPEKDETNYQNSGIYICDDNTTFILDNLSYSITADLKNKTFFAENASEFSSELNDMFARKKQAHNYESFNSYTQIKENEFFYKKKEAADYAEYNSKNSEWMGMLPRESTMINAIKLQENYAKEHHSFFTHNRISNNYQILALEYINQGANSETAKYYYMKSIENDLLSIEYAKNENHFKSAKKRLLYRYKDILSCCNVSEEESALLEMYISVLEMTGNNMLD